MRCATAVCFAVRYATAESLRGATAESLRHTAVTGASSNARSVAFALADGSRARPFPNSKPGRIRSKTLASCAPYAT